MTYSTYIFDLDGTLLDTIGDLAASVNYALRELGMPQHSTAKVQTMVGNGVSMLMERAVPQGRENPLFEKALDTFRQHYTAHWLDTTRPYDGIIETLKELKRRGCRTAVVSNKFDTATKSLCTHFFPGLIDVAVGEHEADGVRKKPAPDTVMVALRELGSSREGAVYIGDSEVDIATAKNSGLPCISVLWGFRSREMLEANGATTFISQPAELLAGPTLHRYHLGHGVTAFSTTRHGGYSTGQYSGFNINRYCGDNPEAVRLNREMLCQMLGIADDRLIMPHQVHQTRMAVIDNSFLSMTAEERTHALEGVDALMTDVSGVCIGVSTADCMPVLLYDKTHHAACAIHAGWRGTAKRIVEKAVGHMASVYGTRPSELTAQTGPGIGIDSFEVGDEVYDAFANEGFNMELISRQYPARGSDSSSNNSPHAPATKKWHIDLTACNRLQLLAAGVQEQHITLAQICTYKSFQTFFSARRLGMASGRIFTGIMLA